MKLTHLAALLATTLSIPAMAAIAPPSSGNGELFLTIADTTAKVSYTLDLGITMDDFIAVHSGSAGRSWNFSLGADANWTAFKNVADEASARWAVLAFDSVGSLQAGLHRAISTLNNGQTITNVRNTSNKQLDDGTVAAASFFSAINATGSHAPQSDFSINGSSLNAETDSGRAYFGESGGLTPSLSTNAQFNSTNLYGDTAGLYFLARSGTSQLTSSKVTTYQFANLAGVNDTVMFANDAVALTVTAVPEPGTYALMAAGLLLVGGIAARRNQR